MSRIKLTEKEREVAELYAQGLDTFEIAARLGIKPNAISMRMTCAAKKRGMQRPHREGQILVARRMLEVS